MSDKFCEYCHSECTRCKEGDVYLFHAKTNDNKWICDICYEYDVCINVQLEQTGKCNGPCDDLNCNHRPKIVGKWLKYKDKIL